MHYLHQNPTVVALAIAIGWMVSPPPTTAQEKLYDGRKLAYWRSALEHIDPGSPTRKLWVKGLSELVQDPALAAADRRRFALRLARMRSDAKPIVSTLSGLVAKADSQDYLWAARALSLIGTAAADATPSLIRFLDNDSLPAIHRTLAFESLGRIGVEHPDAIPKLIEMLQIESNERLSDHDAYLFREMSVKAIGLAGPNADLAAPLLIRIVRNPNEPAALRREAVFALGEMKYRATELALRPLSEALEFDESEAVQDAAAQALRKIGKPGVERLVIYSQATSVEHRLRAISEIGNLRKDELVSQRHYRQTLERAAYDKFDEIRLAGLQALTKAGLSTASHQSLIAKLLTSKDRQIRIAAMKLLIDAKTLTPDALSVVRSLTTNSDRAVARAAAKVLLKQKRD